MKDKRNFVIVLALLFLLGLSFGTVSHSINNNQSSTSEEVGKWDVKITNVEVVTSGEAEDNDYKYKEGTIVLKPILRLVDDNIFYRVTIKNDGTIPATLGRYLYNEKNKNTGIIFTHNKPKEELAPGEETTVDFYVYLEQSKPSEQLEYTNELTAIFEYIQKN